MIRANPFAALVVALATLPPVSAWAADTGDAPTSYGRAAHELVDGAPWLGDDRPDDDGDASLAGSGADGDDTRGIDDEGGVFAFPVLVENAKAYSVNVFASNPGAMRATLVGWIDFDGDGRFDADEAATDTVPPGASDAKYKLRWNALFGVSSDYVGTAYARFRITSGALGAGDAVGDANDGEVEDYAVEILADGDGDEIPDRDDGDNDNDGIPDAVEVVGIDTDGDGVQDYLDGDSDGDGVPDFVEAGADPANPVDSDGDGNADYVDLDSDNDGVADGERAGDSDGDGLGDAREGAGDSDGDGIADVDDLDSDNDLVPDAIEAGAGAALAPGAPPVDSDGDGVADFLDLDSDNDGIADLLEAAGGVFAVSPLDSDGDGRIDDGVPVGANGLADGAETEPDSAVPVFAIADSDGDGTRDYLDTDSDDDGVPDVVEGGGSDSDADGIVDALRDADGDALPDDVDVDLTGGADADGDGIDDLADADTVDGADADGDGIVDTADADADGDGIVDELGGTARTESGLPDSDDDGVPDFRDADAVGGDGGTATGDGTTGGTATGGGTTDGGTTAAGGDDGRPRDDAPAPRVDTGLSGAAGCSVVSTSLSRDPSLAVLAFLAAALLARRRRGSGA